MAEPNGAVADLDAVDDGEQVDEVSSSLPTDKTKSRTKKKAMKQEKDLIKLVFVSDAASGIILFQQVYRWQDGARTAGLGKLIESFYKFAHDIDDGVIDSIFFETPISASKLHRRTQSRPVGGSSSSSSSSSGKSRSMVNETMRLICRKDSGVISAAFYDTQGNNCRIPNALNVKHRQFVTEISRAFHNDYSAMMPSMHPVLQKLNSDSKIDAEDAYTQICSNFMSFGAQVETYRDSIFSGTLSPGNMLSLRAPLTPNGEDTDAK